MKQKLFRLLLFLTPLVILILLEGILRLVEYGGDMRFVTIVERSGRQYYTMNQLVGKRYFRKARPYYRKGQYDFFEVTKSPETIRVFCFGASTTAGFPYEYHATPAYLLRDQLARAFPERNIEVINTAIAAVNSFTVLEFIREMTKYQPDFFVISMGHNEFYGVYGVGSTVSFGKNRTAVRTYLWLLQFKTIHLLRDIITATAGLISGTERVERDPILMEEMAENQTIRYGSPDYQYAVETFRENYEEIILICREAGIPLVVSSLVANERDLPPFVSLHRGGITDEERTQWEEVYAEGRVLERAGDFPAALQKYRFALLIDSSYAELHFRVGACYEALRGFDEARRYYTRARDLEGLRFRAPSEFNLIIRELARTHRVPLADVEATFQQQSANGILGDELIWEHVHPKLEGYFLMAKMWAEAIERNGLSPQVSSDVPDSVYWALSQITDVDRSIGALRIGKLMHRWPFVDRQTTFSPPLTIAAERAAFMYAIDGRISWEEAHFFTAHEHRRSQEWNKAMADYRAVEKVNPDNPRNIMLMGDLLVQMDRHEEAESLFVRSVEIRELPGVRLRMGMAALVKGKPAEAVKHLERYMVLDREGRTDRNEIEKQEVLFHLALAYAELGKVIEARRELLALLNLNPSHSAAQRLLEEINR